MPKKAKKKITFWKRKVKVYAFWSHDVWPFVRSGYAYLRDDGWVEPLVASHRVWPLSVYRCGKMREGVKVASAVAQLAKERSEVRASVQRGFDIRLVMMLPFVRERLEL